MLSYRPLPKQPGIYFFQDAEGRVIYVGKAKSLKDRVSSYFQDKSKLLPKTAQMVAEAKALSFQTVESEIDALLLEANYIRKLSPKYNVNWKDGKSYPLIEITSKEKIPQVHIARKESNPKALYFGPYPTGSDLFGLLRFLRKLFPYVSQNHPHGKPCLRSHLGLCPCPDVFFDRGARLTYVRNLRNLKDFLSGKRQIVQKRLINQMQEASANQEFEKASEIKRQLEQMAYITSPRTLPWEYELNPNLAQDKRAGELKDLAAALEIPYIEKIECFDIANISGKNATGAQVTFVNGLPEKSLYRRYKIKFKNTPDDYAMMAEIISRRLSSDVPLPELMVIDGGKGQLTAVKAVILSKRSESKDLQQDSSKAPKIIALAKRLETIYTDDGSQINLSESSPALHLLQRLRDEAHRFSRKYHILLRSRSMLG